MNGNECGGKFAFRKGIFLVLIAGISWGFLGVFARGLEGRLSSLDIVALRSIFSGILLLTYTAIFRPAMLKMRFRDLWCAAGCGILSITLFNICFFQTVRLTTINAAVVLLYTSPVFVTLLAMLFFKEKFSRKKLAALISVVLGCALVSGIGQVTGNRLSPWVMFLGLSSGFCYALYTIFGRFAQNRNYSGLTITLWTFIFAGMCGFMIMDFTRVTAAFADGGIGFYASLAGMVIFSTILPFGAYTAGLKYLTPTTSAITATVEPLVGTLTGVILFHEHLTFSAAAGMVLILGAMLLCREK